MRKKCPAPTQEPHFLSLAIATAWIGFLANPTSAQSTITMVSVSPTGQAGNIFSSWTQTSLDGRWVAFVSNANNLVPNDTNNDSDVFLRDTVSGTTILVSQGPSGQATSGCDSPSISDDGDIIAFHSGAPNLVANDTNGVDDVFVYFRQTGQLELVSINRLGSGAGDAWSSGAQVSRDGRFIIFTSEATDLVPGDTNSSNDVFVRDLRSQSTFRVTLDNLGNEIASGGSAGRISGDNRSVTFETRASLDPLDTNGAIDIYKRDLASGAVSLVNKNAQGQAGTHRSDFYFGVGARTISDDGRFIVFRSASANLVAGDTNAAEDLFLKDTWTGAIERVNLSTAGSQSLPIDRDGRFNFSISGDGRFVVFSSNYWNLVPNDFNQTHDIFLRDIFHRTTVLIGESLQGGPNNGFDAAPFITSDGQFITFIGRGSDINTSTPNPTGLDQSYLVTRHDTYGYTQHLAGGCNGAGAPPSLTTSPPVIGSTVSVSGSSLAPSQFGIVYWSRPTTTAIPLGGTCRAYLDPASIDILATTLSTAIGEWSLGLPIPNSNLLKGFEINIQAAFETPSVPILALTDGALIRIGN